MILDKVYITISSLAQPLLVLVLFKKHELIINIAIIARISLETLILKVQKYFLLFLSLIKNSTISCHHTLLNHLLSQVHYHLSLTVFQIHNESLVRKNWSIYLLLLQVLREDLLLFLREVVEIMEDVTNTSCTEVEI